MTDKENLKEAWMYGFTSARKNSFTTSVLGPITKKTAEAAFERWWKMNKQEETDSHPWEPQ